MKLTLRPEWRLWPLASFIGLLDIKTGVVVVLLFAVRRRTQRQAHPIYLRPAFQQGCWNIRPHCWRNRRPSVLGTGHHVHLFCRRPIRIVQRP